MITYEIHITRVKVGENRANEKERKKKKKEKKGRDDVHKSLRVEGT